MPTQPLDGKAVGSGRFKTQSAKQAFGNWFAPAFSHSTAFSKAR